MRIELTDIDVPFEVSNDTNADGKDFIRISPNTALMNRDDSYDICLDKDGVKQLIKVLNFISGEL